MPTVGLLHTSSVHVATFDELIGELAPGWTAEHLVDESLLAQARHDGVEATRGAVDRALHDLSVRGVDLIICSCSTIGGLVEAVAEPLAVAVVRVDRPMIELAVRTGRRIAVIAALESTIGPTTGLLSEVADRAGIEPVVEVVVVERAWTRFEAGDIAGYRASIADQLSVVAARSDVIVLAQASMAGAVELAGDVGVPVLASPRTAVRRLLIG